MHITCASIASTVILIRIWLNPTVDEAAVICRIRYVHVVESLCPKKDLIFRLKHSLDLKETKSRISI